MAEQSTEERVAVLEALQGDVRNDLRDIMTNHLPHMEARFSAEIGSLRNWIMGALFSAIMSLVILLGNLVIQVVKYLAA